MSDVKLPEGRYLSCPIDVSPDAGGQTRALLMRNRMFVTEAGIRPTVLTFNALTDLPERREELLRRGLLLPEITTRNIYEHHREHGWDDPPADDPRPLPDLDRFKTKEEFFPDGTPFCYTYSSDALPSDVLDFLRPDGSVYLRRPLFIFKEAETWPTSLLRVAPDNTVSGEFGSIGEWFRGWVKWLSGGERTFMFIDSRFNAQHLVPMDDADHIHVLYLLHNIHLATPRHWSSPFNDIYERLMTKVDHFDAMVTLTQRQQDDIAMRRGRSTNLFVVPNPVDIHDPGPEPPPRDPNQVTVIARLERQKRIEHSIRAFLKAREEVPTARLDIFGAGSRQTYLEELLQELGAEDSVTLRGHDPAARESLWTSSAFLMTSLFEGYPLSTLESLSHGCPVISYDIKYGPREQIENGVDGFLVPNRAIKRMAARLVELLQDPDRVAAMSTAALEKARQHGPDRFLRDWRYTIERAIALKARRTRLDDVRFEVSRLDVAGARRRSKGPRPTTVGRAGRIRVDGVLHVEGSSAGSTLDSVVLSLDLVHEPTGRCTGLPLEVRREGSRFSLSLAGETARAVRAGRPARGVPAAAAARLGELDLEHLAGPARGAPAGRRGVLRGGRHPDTQRQLSRRFTERAADQARARTRSRPDGLARATCAWSASMRLAWRWIRCWERIASS